MSATNVLRTNVLQTNVAQQRIKIEGSHTQCVIPRKRVIARSASSFEEGHHTQCVV